MHAMMLSISEFKIEGSRRVIADPATVDREARALALKDDIGDVVRVGIKLGKIMLERVVSVRSVNRADNALSASSSVRKRLRR